ncbi:hypothetical protein BJY01DRAFT_6871 [Aspergillus pseudoustus]|uniref:Uncharacterized protein n=1 Tax=Aspergillus pseudoustus TaxID=1810923 RepID=A0ABR4JPH2_9EURO
MTRRAHGMNQVNAMPFVSESRVHAIPICCLASQSHPQPQESLLHCPCLPSSHSIHHRIAALQIHHRRQ